MKKHFADNLYSEKQIKALTNSRVRELRGLSFKEWKQYRKNLNK